jgi:hypothetical protein
MDHSWFTYIGLIAALGLAIRIGSDLIKERRQRCDSCRAKIQNPLARFCSKCGASLLTRYELPAAQPAEQSAWKSVPVLVRLGIWVIVIPPLLWFGSCAACTMLGALNATLSAPHH